MTTTTHRIKPGPATIYTAHCQCGWGCDDCEHADKAHAAAHGLRHIGYIVRRYSGQRLSHEILPLRSWQAVRS